MLQVRSLTFAALLLLMGGARAGAGGLGTAGPILSFGWAQCAAGYEAMTRGDCDPPAVSADLSAPQRSRAHVKRAERLLGFMRMGPALAELDAAIKDDPRNGWAYLLRGRLKIPGRVDDAEQDINAALAIDPANSDALATRAYLIADRNLPGAFHDVNAAIASNGQNADALWIRATIFVRMGRADDAERDLTAGLSLEPDNQRLKSSRAEVRMMRGKTKQALQDTDWGPGQPVGFQMLQIRAIAHVKAGDFAHAIDDLDEILGKPGETRASILGRQGFDLHIQRAIAFARTGRPTDAKRDLAAVLNEGGLQAVLQAQLYLRSRGFRDVPLDGKRSNQLDEALQTCIINDACAGGLAIRG